MKAMPWRRLESMERSKTLGIGGRRVRSRTAMSDVTRISAVVTIIRVRLSRSRVSRAAVTGSSDVYNIEIPAGLIRLEYSAASTGGGPSSGSVLGDSVGSC